MGLSASQARFLQLTARNSDVEYQTQQINFERLQLSESLSQISEEYENKISNRVLLFNFNSGSGNTNVDITYQNYKSYMNQQISGMTFSDRKYFLVSSNAEKIIVASEADRDAIINSNTQKISTNNVFNALEKYKKAQEEGTLDKLDPFIKKIATTNLDEYEVDYENRTLTDSSGNKIDGITINVFDVDDFIIVDDLEDADNFQSALQSGIYQFAQLYQDEITGEQKLKAQGIDSMAGKITEDYNRTDDAQAEAEYDRAKAKIQNIDKKLELELDRLETERSAIQTEIESISKVIDDNIDKSFKTFNG